MSRKNVDRNNRLRSEVVGIRMSKEERERFNALAELSGMTKQDYALSCIFDHQVNISGNPRVFRNLSKKMDSIRDELAGIVEEKDLSEEKLEMMQTVLEMYTKLTETERKETE